MAHRVAPRAETDLDEIWFYVAKESGSIEIANRLIDTLTHRFFVLAGFPYIGRSRDEDFGARMPQRDCGRICDRLLCRK
jgi:plasmid stabilization system protein ParE